MDFLSLVIERQRRGEVIGEVSLGLMTSGLFVVTGCYMMMAAVAVVVYSGVFVPALLLLLLLLLFLFFLTVINVSYLHLTSFSQAEARNCIVTAAIGRKPSQYTSLAYGFSNTAQTTELSDLTQVGPHRVKSSARDKSEGSLTAS